MKRLVLVRHAHANANALDLVSCTPPGAGLSDRGVEEGLALRETLAHEPLDLGVATRLVRTQETLELALGAREIPRVVLPAFDEIHFGSYEGGPLADYRAWAWTNEPDVACPGGGESRADAAVRIAGALHELLARAEEVVLAVSHALPIRYVLDASDGSFPAARIEPVAHAAPYTLDGDAVELAAETLRVWATAPRFADAPDGS